MRAIAPNNLAKYTYMNERRLLYIRLNTRSFHHARHPLGAIVRVGVSAPQLFTHRMDNYSRYNFPPPTDYYPVLEGADEIIYSCEAIVLLTCGFFFVFLVLLKV